MVKGGLLDPSDSSPNWYTYAHLPCHTHQITAIRETFEETGLLAHMRPSLSLDQRMKWRQQVLLCGKKLNPKKIHASPSQFFEFCQSHDCMPNLSLLIHWSNWITPMIESVRFDTHFFLTLVKPEDVVEGLLPDGDETVDLEWLSVHEALDAVKQGRKFDLS